MQIYRAKDGSNNAFEIPNFAIIQIIAQFIAIYVLYFAFINECE